MEAFSKSFCSSHFWINFFFRSVAELSSWESVVILGILSSFSLIRILFAGSHVLLFLGLFTLSWFV